MIARENGYALRLPRRFPEARNHLFAFAALLCLLLLVYGNSFRGAWHFDDRPNIVDNASVHLQQLSLDGLQKTFYYLGDLLRPASYASFALNYYVGGLDPFGYHVVNLAIHYLAAVFLYLFLVRTLQLPILGGRYEPEAHAIALLAVVLWAVSPVQVLAVTYIVQRMASLAGMFSIAALYFYLQGRTASGRGARLAFFLCCLAAALLAVGSKENAAMLPVTMFLYDLFLIQGITRETAKQSLKRAFLPLLVVLALASFYTDIASVLDGYRIRPYTLTERLLTEPRILLFYASLLLYPLHSRLTFLHDIAVSHALLDPWTTLPAILILVAILGYALMGARKRPLLSFCILFFFLNHLIEGSFIPAELVFEHRNYLPSMLFFLPLAIALLHGIHFFAYKPALQGLAALGIVVLIATQGHTVHLRNEALRSGIALWSDNVEKYPLLSRPHNNLGIAYLQQGRRLEAAIEFMEALRLNNFENLPMEARVEANLGTHYLHEGQMEDAYRHYRRSLRISPANAQPYGGIAEIELRRGNLDAADRNIQKALQRDPDIAEYRELAGLILLKRGDADNAAKEANRVLQRDPERFFPRYLLAEAQWRKGRLDRAAFYLKELLKIHPLYVPAYLFLAEVSQARGDRAALEDAVANLLYLKHDKTWEDFLCQAEADRAMSVHAFDLQRTLSVIRSHLADLAKNAKPIACHP